MQAVLPTMLENGGGSIINNSSIAGMSAVVGCPNLAYVSSKFAVRGMTKHVAVEYGDKNIRVNSIHPGYVKTPMNEDALDEAGYEAVNVIPMRRFGEAFEVANLMIFLASDESACALSCLCLSPDSGAVSSAVAMSLVPATTLV